MRMGMRIRGFRRGRPKTLSPAEFEVGVLKLLEWAQDSGRQAPSQAAEATSV
jgi:hypothetical protein